MKFFKRLFCGFLAGISLFSCGCGILNKDSSAERNLTVQCAPCTVEEIWQWNEEAFKEFYFIKQPYNSMGEQISLVKCMVSGYEEWQGRWPLDDLPVGEYEIRFYTDEGFTMPVPWISEEGLMRWEISYEKELTLQVTISTEYPDICDAEYREANGLWTDPEQEKWYPDFMTELRKNLKTP